MHTGKQLQADAVCYLYCGKKDTGVIEAGNEGVIGILSSPGAVASVPDGLSTGKMN